jgi:hypothetical protein
MARLKALKNYKVDDDCLWRITDIATRQAVEKGGYRYGKVTAVFHFHHTTEGTKYTSDHSSRYQDCLSRAERDHHQSGELARTVDRACKNMCQAHRPDLPHVRRDTSIDDVFLPILDRQWVLEHGPAWISRYRSKGTCASVA